MKKLLFLILFLVAFAAVALAANPFDISYPITDLGNCGSQQECKAYCDDSANQEQCQQWAEDNDFAPKRETPVGGQGNREHEQLDEEALANAPGGCVSLRECDTYCRVEEHLDECLDYSVKYGYTTAEEAETIRTQAARGGPGSCKSEAECDTYCRNPQNARECMTFVVEEGKISQEEADFMIEQMSKLGGPSGKSTGKGSAEPKIKEDKVLEVLKTETGPGGCKNLEECAKYCMGGEHMNECMDFAAKHGLMEPEEMEKVKKLSQMGGPGGCKNAQECDAFCSKPGNSEICFQFSKDHGFMSDEEIQMMEKQMSIIKKLDRQAGPGGCRSKEECGAYCDDPSKIEECINFAGQTGMMNPEALKNMMGQTQEAKDKLQDLERYRSERAINEADGTRGHVPPRGNFFGGQQSPGATESGEQEQQLPSWGTYGPPPEGWTPPAGYEGQTPPEGFVPPTNYQYGPPPGPTDIQQYAPPPSGESVPPPTSSRFLNILGAVWSSLTNLFKVEQ